MPVSPARAAAFDILLRVERESSYASELLHSGRCGELSSSDHGLATELVFGVERWRMTLDAVIAQASSKAVGKLDPEVLTALRLGAYQLFFLDRIPARAAIHESVELVKRARKRSAAPFANAVLRKLAAEPHNAPNTSTGTARTPEALARRFAHPVWLIQRWTERFGLEAAKSICAYDQQVPGTTIRVRDETLAHDLAAHDIELAPGEFLTSARRVVHGDVTRMPEFAMNRFAIQDEASQLVAALVGNGSRILDACAAPGGKTWSIADRNPQAAVTAVELHPHRAELLRKRVPSANVSVITGDLRDLPVTALFDRVLVDAPCSGTGTLARNPEIKWRLQPEDLADLQARQTSILQAALNHVASHGRLIYSTCSLEHEENEFVIEQALAASPDFQLIECSKDLQRIQHQGELTADPSSLTDGPYLRTVPGIHHCDGFFAAILEKE